MWGGLVRHVPCTEDGWLVKFWSIIFRSDQQKMLTRYREYFVITSPPTALQQHFRGDKRSFYLTLHEQCLDLMLKLKILLNNINHNREHFKSFGPVCERYHEYPLLVV